MELKIKVRIQVRKDFLGLPGDVWISQGLDYTRDRENPIFRRHRPEKDGTVEWSRLQRFKNLNAYSDLHTVEVALESFINLQQFKAYMGVL